MGDYVSRNTALNCFHDWIDQHGDVHTADEMTEYNAIAALPAADVVEVVRCRDCKHWLPQRQFGLDDEFDIYNDYCALLVPDDHYYAISRRSEDFCSYAERREDG